MKLKTTLKATITGLACLGMFLPADLMAAPPEAKSKPAGRASLTGKVTPGKTASTRSSRAKTRIIDVELAKGNRLSGQVINAKKASVEKAVISVRTAKQEVGRSISNKSGGFTIEKVPTGTFYVVAGTGHGVYRLWKNGTAPKKALKRIKIVSDRTVIRAQNDGEVLYDEDGTAFGQVRVTDPDGGAFAFSPGGDAGFAGGLTGAGIGMGGGSLIGGLGVFDALAIGGGLAGAGFGIHNYYENKDQDDAINRIANTTN
jgi:hypothetical protein